MAVQRRLDRVGRLRVSLSLRPLHHEADEVPHRSDSGYSVVVGTGRGVVGRTLCADARGADPDGSNGERTGLRLAD